MTTTTLANDPGGLLGKPTIEATLSIYEARHIFAALALLAEQPAAPGDAAAVCDLAARFRHSLMSLGDRDPLLPEVDPFLGMIDDS